MLILIYQDKECYRQQEGCNWKEILKTWFSLLNDEKWKLILSVAIVDLLKLNWRFWNYAERNY